MLNQRQKSQLEQYAKPQRETFEVHVCINPFQYFTREAGGGSGHRIIVKLFYPSDGATDFSNEISRCRYGYTAIDKAKEIARFLADDLELGRDIVKIKG